MRSVIIYTGIFEPGASRERSEVAVGRLINFLVSTNIDQLREAIRAGIDVPRLYASGARYKRSRIWRDLYATYANGGADCKSLTAIRLAELVVYGEDSDARAILRGGPNKGGVGSRYHVLIQRSDGSEEDPSRILGMGRR
jgi:hypothetical protein